MAASETLCCCEYENMHGDRSHLLAFCCDCEAFDQTCDRLLTCRAVPTETLQRLWATIHDRCRIPWFSGKGAIQVKLDVIVPMIMVPACLSFGTLGYFATIAVLMFMPIFMLTFYTIWRRQGHKRTPFFFVWGLTSVVFSFLVFSGFVISFREILLWEILLLFSALFFMFYALLHARKQPGYFSVVSKSQNKELRYRPSLTNGHVKSGNNFDDEKEFLELQMNRNEDATLPAEKVTWIDSRPIKDGKLMIKCNYCNFQRPPRAGHCNICGLCIAVRDHHCVWIDNCIGSNNHKSFLAAMFLFIFCGCYGSHLTLTTICTPEMYFDWILVPSDCRWLYEDFSISLCFVTSCYSLVSCAIMTFGFIHQIILISQNLTSQELHTASIRGLTQCVFFARNNVHNQGFLRNWIEFLFYRKRRTSSQIPL
ncbi:hypothetical protein SNE40_015897 [Patella caerulea]|uniref:Palmitoyltransferase n=1 Tax=Patella caerulea TaxID=87958 RepID=A0AAN8JAW0_PATCE